VHEKGDLGLVAQASRGNQKTMMKPKPLTTLSVFEALKAISNMSGNSCQSRKMDTINKLLVSCTSFEPKFIMRYILYNLLIFRRKTSNWTGTANYPYISRSSFRAK
jgi:DNA ligase-1